MITITYKHECKFNNLLVPNKAISLYLSGNIVGPTYCVKDFKYQIFKTIFKIGNLMI